MAFRVLCQYFNKMPDIAILDPLACLPIATEWDGTSYNEIQWLGGNVPILIPSDFYSNFYVYGNGTGSIQITKEQAYSFYLNAKLISVNVVESYTGIDVNVTYPVICGEAYLESDMEPPAPDPYKPTQITDQFGVNGIAGIACGVTRSGEIYASDRFSLNLFSSDSDNYLASDLNSISSATIGTYGPAIFPVDYRLDSILFFKDADENYYVRPIFFGYGFNLIQNTNFLAIPPAPSVVGSFDFNGWGTCDMYGEVSPTAGLVSNVTLSLVQEWDYSP